MAVGGLRRRWGEIENKIIEKITVLWCGGNSCEWGKEEEGGIVVDWCDFWCVLAAGHLNNVGDEEKHVHADLSNWIVSWATTGQLLKKTCTVKGVT